MKNNCYVQNLVVGKVYQCYDSCRFRDLIWYTENDNKQTEVLSNSIFIFLGSVFNNRNYYKTVTIKGLVDGKVLYAIDCATSFNYKEIK